MLLYLKCQIATSLSWSFGDYPKVTVRYISCEWPEPLEWTSFCYNRLSNIHRSPNGVRILLSDPFKQSRPGYQNPMIPLPLFPAHPTRCVVSTHPWHETPSFMFHQNARCFHIFPTRKLPFFVENMMLFLIRWHSTHDLKLYCPFRPSIPLTATSSRGIPIFDPLEKRYLVVRYWSIPFEAASVADFQPLYRKTICNAPILRHQHNVSCLLSKQVKSSHRGNFTRPKKYLTNGFPRDFHQHSSRTKAAVKVTCEID